MFDNLTASVRKRSTAVSSSVVLLPVTPGSSFLTGLMRRTAFVFRKSMWSRGYATPGLERPRLGGSNRVICLRTSDLCLSCVMERLAGDSRSSCRTQRTVANHSWSNGDEEEHYTSLSTLLGGEIYKRQDSSTVQNTPPILMQVAFQHVSTASPQ